MAHHPIGGARQVRAAIYLVTATLLVHAVAPAPATAQSPRAGRAEKAVPTEDSRRPAKPKEQGHGTEGLPAPVVEMRDAILSAVRSGRIEELRVAIELNEIKPAFSDKPVADPIAHLKAQSADGEGRELLAALGNVLEAGWIAVPLGRDLENNRIYVWPRLAETGLAGLSPADEVELYRLVPVAEARRMRAAGRYDHWRIGIGADGVWHYLAR